MLTLDELKALKLNQLDSIASDRQSALIKGREAEALLWEGKEIAAKAVLGGGAAPIWLIEETRIRFGLHFDEYERLEISVRALSQKIVTNAERLRLMSSKVSGMRGFVRQLITDANSIEELESIDLTKPWF